MEWGSEGSSLVVVVSTPALIPGVCLSPVSWVMGMECRCMVVLGAVLGSLVLLLRGVELFPWLVHVAWIAGECVQGANGGSWQIGPPLLRVCWPSASFHRFEHRQLASVEIVWPVAGLVSSQDIGGMAMGNRPVVVWIGLARLSVKSSGRKFGT